MNRNLIIYKIDNIDNKLRMTVISIIEDITPTITATIKPDSINRSYGGIIGFTILGLLLLGCVAMITVDMYKRIKIHREMRRKYEIID